MTTLPTWYAIHPAGHVSRQCVAADKREATAKLAPGEGEYVTSAASWACRETRHRLRRPAKGWQERAVLSPAVEGEARAELTRVMLLGIQPKGGRPSLKAQRVYAARKRGLKPMVLTGAGQEAKRQASIRAGVARRAAKRGNG